MFRKLSFAPTYKTLLSTRQTAVAVCRLSDSSDDQTSDGAHKRAFPYSHIEESTIHRHTSVPLSLHKGASFCKLAFCQHLYFCFFIKRKKCNILPSSPSDSHSGFYFPPFVETNGFETTDCLECLQILNILYMAGGSTLKLEIGHYALY